MGCETDSKDKVRRGLGGGGGIITIQIFCLAANISAVNFCHVFACLLLSGVVLSFLVVIPDELLSHCLLLFLLYLLPSPNLVVSSSVSSCASVPSDSLLVVSPLQLRSLDLASLGSVHQLAKGEGE